ncbi:MAG: MFS transporter [Pseudonocardia sp.]|nr:MFS transporter [Pseudonocardia sp.]
MPEHTAWVVALLLFAAGVTAALQVGKAVAALPTLRADLGLSLVTGGWVIAAVNVAGGLFGLVLGATVDRFGHRRSMLTGLAIVAASSAVGAAAGNGGPLLATRFGEGLGFLLTVLAVPPLLLRVTAPAHRGVVFGLWGAFMPTGTALGVLVTPVLLGHGGWRGLWLLGAALTGVAAVAAGIATRAQRPARHGTGPAGRLLPVLRAVVTAPGPLLAAGAFAMYAMQFLAVFGFLPTLLIDDGVPVATAALLTAVATFANAPGNLLGGWLRGRGTPRWVLICAGSVLMGLSALGVFAGDVPLGWRYACCVLLSLASGVIPATLLGATPELAPSPSDVFSPHSPAVAATVGIVMQGSMLGQVAGPPIVAAVATSVGGWGATPAVLGLAALVAAVLGLALRRFEHPR